MVLLMMATAAANEYTNYIVGGDAGWFFDPVTNASASKLHLLGHKSNHQSQRLSQSTCKKIVAVSREDDGAQAR
ncbi:hypothetical protein SLEP1_g10662 [Rubroshorea leprosula]|uniref:Phytocyanin domain-containing protein n=1 Tax=Rubroshorea leprosula TaxID=152421 RepID=A0AAV5IGN5_9ROSI|nr:hypothetical protein SLEP1_g10662 [Rubroshorea leprosula]